MPRPKKDETAESARDLPAEVKDLLMKRAKDIFEKEPQQAFVPNNLDALVADIITLFN